MSYSLYDYYTLLDLIKSYSTDDADVVPYGLVNSDGAVSLYTILDSINSYQWDEFYNATGINKTEAQTTGTLNKLWAYIVAKFRNDYVVKVESGETPDYTEFMQNLLVKMVETYPRYYKILSLYTAEEDALMDDVKNYIKFDDTPQTDETYGTSEFMSTYTEYSNEYTTKMARINEIERLYNDVMQEWCDEFKNAFLEV